MAKPLSRAGLPPERVSYLLGGSKVRPLPGRKSSRPAVYCIVTAASEQPNPLPFFLSRLLSLSFFLASPGGLLPFEFSLLPVPVREPRSTVPVLLSSGAASPRPRVPLKRPLHSQPLEKLNSRHSAAPFHHRRGRHRSSLLVHQSCVNVELAGTLKSPALRQNGDDP
jgi:hypothetical protein